MLPHTLCHTLACTSLHTHSHTQPHALPHTPTPYTSNPTSPPHPTQEGHALACNIATLLPLHNLIQEGNRAAKDVNSKQRLSLASHGVTLKDYGLCYGSFRARQRFVYNFSNTQGHVLQVRAGQHQVQACCSSSV